MKRIMGTITRTFLPRGFAFVRGDDNKDYMLQADELEGAEWGHEAIHGGVRIEFTPRELSPARLRAAKVRLIGEAMGIFVPEEPRKGCLADELLLPNDDDRKRCGCVDCLEDLRAKALAIQQGNRL